ncbi:site-specific integrase [Xylanimonas protaetiae]|uniref:Site-specific integrase n=1 Tax=Xylanimonas protaetiae TaxID=2509457 RepID=A0A4P6F4T0_9MICO|nr:site-specific integrase [Xylanimonas protaetiae]QAY69733.1 site-specific integrase [Xylanimonas protaetiae]
MNRVLMALTKAKRYATARQCRNVMQQVMMLCVRYGAAPFNPVRDAITVRTPKRGDVETIALEDIALLRKAVRVWEDRPAIRGLRNVSLLPQIVDTMLGTGLRIGECLALREVDLDLDAEVPTLTVDGTIVRANGRLFRQSSPKSDSSQRTVTLPNFVVVALREALDLGLDGGPDGLVFPTSTGRPRSPSNVRTQLKHAQAGTGLRVRPHDFRRTVGTAVANSTSIASASAQLGHAGEATTRLHYVKRNRLAPDVRDVIDRLVTRASADLLAEGKKQ